MIEPMPRLARPARNALRARPLRAALRDLEGPSRGAVGAALSALVVGCSGGSASPAPEPLVLVAGSATLEVGALDASLTLRRGGEALVVFPPDALELGLVDALDEARNYDPYRLYVPFSLWEEPPGLRFVAPREVSVASHTEEAITLALDYGEARASLTLTAAEDGAFDAALVPEASATVAFQRVRPRVTDAEGFYGLGEYFDSPEHRGRVRAMQIEAGVELESLYNEAHVPVPFLVSTAGWGLFVDSVYPGAFSVAASGSDRVEAAFGTGSASHEGLAFHLFAEAHPLDLTKHLYARVGAPKLPAPWALGPWIWRDENEGQAEVLGDVAALRELDLATTGVWIDRPYASAVNTFDYEPGAYPDPAQMIATMHALGLRTALWHVPYLDEADPLAASLVAEATAEGYYPLDVGLPLNKWGDPIDPTNPEAVAWWRAHLEAYRALGVEGYKLDYGEDVIIGPTTLRETWRFADGSDERTMHKGFQPAYHAMYAPLLPDDGGFLLCRSATLGDQANGVIIWPGDLDATFDRHGDHAVSPSGESYVAVGGLHASVVAGLSLGPSGFPFYGADTGGYRHSPPDKELMTRWFQQTALSTVMQVGNSASTVPWEADPATGYDAEMLAWYRDYARLHLRLFPYLWGYAEALATTGRPIQRALGLAYPELGAHPSDEYLLGDFLLVAPVVERGATTRALHLPPGEWIDVWTGARLAGPGPTTVDAPLERIPLFLKAGGLVPRLRPTIDTLSPVAEPDAIDSYATSVGDLWVWTAPGPPGSETTLDGMGASRFVSRASEQLFEVELALGATGASGVVLEVLAWGAPPEAVSSDGGELALLTSEDDVRAGAVGWVWLDELGGRLLVRVDAGAERVAITR